ncbi:MAG: lysophospholipid acyltransferase family protein [Alphaproteobacteria bacterium]|nr:lysophospholipid acyltransferase family protein [Alphaproteobacteria bacterium]
MKGHIPGLKRNFFKRFITDPIEGITVGLILLIFMILPLRAAEKTGACLGAFVGLVARRRNRIGLLNLRIAFPEKTEKERKKILRDMWKHFGRLIADLPHNRQVLKEASFKDVKYLREAYAAGKGGFVCSAHIGNWELSVAKQIAPGFVMNPVYRPANNWFLDKLLFSRRKGVKIPKGRTGARLMIETLKQGKFISILCDQKFREGMTLSLFGMPAQTATAMATLALKMNVPIIMVKAIQQTDGHYLLTVYPPIPIPIGLARAEAEKQIMTTVNQMYEQWIRENPEQWLWIHRRFDKHLYK